MIVVDTSALIAIFLAEVDAVRYARAIDRTDRALIGAPTAFEFILVCVSRLGAPGAMAAREFLSRPDFEIVAFSPAHIAAAQDALLHFRGRPAQLNFGDCMTYAVAKMLDLPLLYKGNDFGHTDIRSAL